VIKCAGHAEKRVDDVVTQMKTEEQKTRAAANTARKSASGASFFTFLSLLFAVFIVSVAGAIGGCQRDEA
jgi:hypothetical protein